MYLPVQQRSSLACKRASLKPECGALGTHDAPPGAEKNDAIGQPALACTHRLEYDAFNTGGKMKNRIVIAVALMWAFASCSSFVTANKGRAGGIGKSNKTVVFIHGMYMTPKSWIPWKEKFEKEGYKVYTPGWPLHEVSPEERRAKHPDPALAKLTLEDVLEHYRKFLGDLKGEKPILVGHSMGGLISQLLLAEGRASAAIAIDSGPPKGVVSQATALRHGFSFVRAAWPLISPFAKDDEPIEMTPEKFARIFTNGMSEADQKTAFDEQAGPESRRVGKGALTDTALLPVVTARGPLLLIAGETDRIIPPSVTRLNYEAYDEKIGYTEYKEFPGRPHYIVGSPGWTEVADFILQWIAKNQ